jgi:hypothetical protein
LHFVAHRSSRSDNYQATLERPGKVWTVMPGRLFHIH